MYSSGNPSAWTDKESSPACGVRAAAWPAPHNRTARPYKTGHVCMRACMHGCRYAYGCIWIKISNEWRTKEHRNGYVMHSGMHACVNARMQHTHTDTHTHVHMCMYVCMYACTYVCVCEYIMTCKAMHGRWTDYACCVYSACWLCYNSCACQWRYVCKASHVCCAFAFCAIKAFEISYVYTNVLYALCILLAMHLMYKTIKCRTCKICMALETCMLVM